MWSTPKPPVSLPENSNITELDLVLLLLVIARIFPSTILVIFVIGAIVSTFQVNLAGVRSLFPTLSFENTLKSCGPSVMMVLLYCTGLVHAVKFESSRLHSNSRTPKPPMSLPVKVNVIEVNLLLLPFVREISSPTIALLIEVVAATVSTVHPNDAGESSVFPTPSLDLILTEWYPSANMLD